MTIRRKMLKVKGERDAPLTQSRITQPRGKRSRNLAHVDPEAKMKTGKASTGRRRAINLKVAAKVEKRAGDPKAETSPTSIKVRIEEVAQGAKTRVTKGKKSVKLITTKTETKAMTLIKSLERKTKEETGRRAGRGPKTRKGPPEMNAAPARIDLPRKGENRAEREAENAVEKGGGRIRDVEVPGTGNIERGALTEPRPESRRGAGGPGAGAAGGAAAEIARPTDGTEKPPTKDGGEAEAQTATRTGEEGATEARPETGGVPPGQTAREAKTARGRGPAPARTVTDPEAEVLLLFQDIHLLNFIVSFRRGLSHIHHPVKFFKNHPSLV